MSGRFDTCLPLLLAAEGGYVDSPKDPGGCTNLGVTLARWQDYVGHPVTPSDMRALTGDVVAPFYRARYWDAICADDLAPGIDYISFDGAVNQGPGRITRWLQQSANVADDGIMGPKSLAAIRNTGAELMIQRLSLKRWIAYRAAPAFDTFGKGWFSRLDAVTTAANAMAMEAVR